MDLESFRELFAPRGRAALQAALDLQPVEAGYLKYFTALSRLFPSNLAQAALEVAILRGEAQPKFPFAERMYFTRPALEQASAWEVSAYRVQRFHQLDLLADLGCSIGGDTLALATVAPALGIDLDPLRLAIARANAIALGLSDKTRFVQADLSHPLPLAKSRRRSLGLFFDPARRSGHRRVYSVRDYQPPLSVIRDWLEHYPALGVKISPGVKLDELAPFEAEVEFISLRGELKEATLWFGPLKTAGRRATILPGPHTLSDPDRITAGEQAPLPLSEPMAYLYEPDASVLRAGLVASLGRQLGAAQLDPDIAYLTSARLLPTPFARAWQVQDWMPFSMKRLRAALRERGVGRIVVKKRGSPLTPEELIRAMRLEGDQERVVFLTHLRGRPVAVICFPMDNSEVVD